MAVARRVSGANASSGSGGSAPTGAAGGSLAGTYPNPTIAAGAITTTEILDGTIANGDLAGSIAPSKITGTAITAADTGTVTSAMILDGTVAVGDLAAGIPQSLTAGGSSTKAVADSSTHTTTGDQLIWNGSQWVDYQPPMQARGFLAWNYDVNQAVSSQVCVSQSLYVLKVPVPYNISVTGIVAAVGTAGSTLTSNQNLVTLYNQAGTKQADSADQSAVWTSTGVYPMALTGGPYAITGGIGAYCWVSILSNGTTPAAFRATGASAVPQNSISTGNATGAAMYAARNGTAVTATATITPSSNSATAALPFWVALY